MAQSSRAIGAASPFLANRSRCPHPVFNDFWLDDSAQAATTDLRGYYDQLYLLTVSQWHLAPLFQSHAASRSRGGSAKLLVAAAHRLDISQHLIGELLGCLAL